MMAGMKIEVRQLQELTDDERRQLEDLDRQSESEMPDDGYVWFTRYPWRVLVWIDGQLVSTLGIVERTLLVDGHPLRVGGIGNVGTLPAWRRRGLAAAALDRARRFICKTLGASFCFLFCEPELAAFYSHLGWQPVGGSLTFDQPTGKVAYSKPAMYLPCQCQEWPAGAIDVGGLPF